MVDQFRLEAEYYDEIWGSKKRYNEETQFLDTLFKDFNIKKVLDLACGTGGHCIELSKLGYRVTGLDISREMLNEAKKKYSNHSILAKLILGDMRKAYSTLMNSKITLPFDAIICMGNSLAHMIDDTMLTRTLIEVQKILKRGGLFIFCVQNAEGLRDDLMKKLRVDNIINEPNLQLALLSYNYRDEGNSDILIWNTYWVIRDNKKVDFRVRTHPLRWFRFDALKELLKTHGFLVVGRYGDSLGKEEFDVKSHDAIYLVCRKK